MTITLPPELNDAQPTVNPNWTAAKVTEKLAEPKKLADGSSITKRTSQIVYTAKAPLSPELRDALVLSVKLPDAAGKTLYFPTLQNCEAGPDRLVRRSRRTGQDEQSLKSPGAVGHRHRRPLRGDGHGAHAGRASDTAQTTAPGGRRDRRRRPRPGAGRAWSPASAAWSWAGSRCCAEPASRRVRSRSPAPKE